MIRDNSDVRMMAPFNQGTLRLTGLEKKITEGNLNEKGMNTIIDHHS